MKADTKAPAALPPVADTPGNDVAAQLHALDEQQRALAQQRQQLRKSYFDQTATAMKTSIAQLQSLGFDLIQIAKAVGLASPGRRPERKGTGPTTNEGWFRTYRTRAIQTYLKSHPGIAELLDAEKVPVADFAQHIPPTDLAAIDTDAQAKADAKCPCVSA